MADRTSLNRSRWVPRLVLGVVLAIALVPAGFAQEPEDDPPATERELREAMHRFFEKRLRAELQLTDAQMEHIIPRVRRSEELRAEARRERQQAVRQLQRGMQGGADDAELQRRLDALDAIEKRQLEHVRGLQDEIDSVLSVRQRVQFRFFTQRFRAELQRRIREQREGGGGVRPFERRRRP